MGEIGDVIIFQYKKPECKCAAGQSCKSCNNSIIYPYIYNKERCNSRVFCTIDIGDLENTILNDIYHSCIKYDVKCMYSFRSVANHFAIGHIETGPGAPVIRIAIDNSEINIELHPEYIVIAAKSTVFKYDYTNYDECLAKINKLLLLRQPKL